MKNKQIEGQLTLDFCFNTENYVVQSNDLIAAKQALSLNSAKIFRAAVMQIKPDDNEFGYYKVSIRELSELLHVSASNLYRDVSKIEEELSTGVAVFKKYTKNKIRDIRVPLTSICDYESSVGLKIELNPKLKPYLLNLKRQYTQIPDNDYNLFTSVYALRIYELLMSKITLKVLPMEGTYIEIPINEIKEATSTEHYSRAADFKRKVLDISVKNINTHTMFRVSYTRLKKRSGKYDTVRFFINMVYHPDCYLPKEDKVG